LQHEFLGQLLEWNRIEQGQHVIDGKDDDHRLLVQLDRVETVAIVELGLVVGSG